MIGIELAEQGLLPEALIRVGIRRLCAARLRSEAARHRDRGQALASWLEVMEASPIALSPDAANAQHYEVPPEFFAAVLGPALKYSAALWTPGTTTLAAAENAMLELTMARAELADGQRILELGCGWGSLSLAMAARYPRAEIVAVSNSHRQAVWIGARAAERGLPNLNVLTADMNSFQAPGRFHRVVSVEMFEHMRNWGALLRRVHGWLRPDGRLFMHVFAHREYAYPYADADRSDWMARHFFSGGMMPSVELVSRVDAPLTLQHTFTLPGWHYARTAEAWHHNLMTRRQLVVELLARDLGAAGARVMARRWRIFFLACAELFGFAEGQEWVVAHHLLAPR